MLTARGFLNTEVRALHRWAISLIVLTAAIAFPSMTAAQSHSDTFSNPAVASDTHWLVAGAESEVKLSFADSPYHVFHMASVESNCIVVEQESSQSRLYLTLEAPNTGACSLTVVVHHSPKGEEADGDVLATHNVTLHAFDSSEDFPAVDPAMQSSAYVEDTDNIVTLEGKIENAIAVSPSNPFVAHLHRGSDGASYESPAEIQSVQFDAETGEFSIFISPHAFGFHSLEVAVDFANNESGTLYLGFACAYSPPAIQVFPGFVPLNQQVEAVVLANFAFEQDDEFYIAEGNGTISSVVIQSNIVTMNATFTSLPASVVLSRDDGDIVFQDDVEDEWEDPKIPDFVEELRDQLNGKFQKNAQGNCLELVGAVDWSSLRDALKPKRPDTAIVNTTVEAPDGTNVPAIVYTGLGSADSGDEAPTGSGGAQGGDRQTAGEGIEGDPGTDGGLPGQDGAQGQKGGQGVRGGKGHTGDEGKTPDRAEAGGTPPEKVFTVPETDYPILVVVMGADGAIGGEGGIGGLGGKGGRGGKGGKGGKGGTGGTGADGPINGQGVYIGQGGSGGKGGRGGTGGPGGEGGVGGVGGKGGEGGHGGHAQPITVTVHDWVFLVGLEGDGGDGGKGGNGGRGGLPGDLGLSGDGGDGGDGGEPGDGNPDGEEGDTGALGDQGPEGVIGSPGSGGGYGRGGNGGESSGTIEVEGVPCDEVIQPGIEGSDGVSGSTGDPG